MGDRARVPNLASMLADALIDQGRFDEAQEQVEVAGKPPRRAMRPARPRGAWPRRGVLVRRGSADEAVALAREAIEILARTDELMSLPTSYGPPGRGARAGRPRRRGGAALSGGDRRPRSRARRSRSGSPRPASTRWPRPLAPRSPCDRCRARPSVATRRTRRDRGTDEGVGRRAVPRATTTATDGERACGTSPTSTRNAARRRHLLRHRSDGEPVACGGWSRRDRLSREWRRDGDARLLDPATEPARVRAMFVRADWTRRGLGRRILEACEAAARREGSRSWSLMATLSGVGLYRAYGFVDVDELEVTMPDGVTLACVSMEMLLPPAPEAPRSRADQRRAGLEGWQRRRRVPGRPTWPIEPRLV